MDIWRDMPTIEVHREYHPHGKRIAVVVAHQHLRVLGEDFRIDCGLEMALA